MLNVLAVWHEIEYQILREVELCSGWKQIFLHDLRLVEI